MDPKQTILDILRDAEDHTARAKVVNGMTDLLVWFLRGGAVPEVSPSVVDEIQDIGSAVADLVEQ